MQRGWQWRGEGLHAVYVFQGEIPQAAIIVSKTLIAKASARHAVRRTIFNLLEPLVLKSEKLQIIIRVTSGKILASGLEEIEQQFQSLLQDIKKNTPHG